MVEATNGLGSVSVAPSSTCHWGSQEGHLASESGSGLNLSWPLRGFGPQQMSAPDLINLLMSAFLKPWTEFSLVIDRTD